MARSAEPLIPSWNFGDRLAKARKCAGLTSAEMARILHVSPRTIVGWETNEHLPRYTSVVAWADVCNVSLEWLERGSDQGERPSDWNTSLLDNAA